MRFVAAGSSADGGEPALPPPPVQGWVPLLPAAAADGSLSAIAEGVPKLLTRLKEQFTLAPQVAAVAGELATRGTCVRVFLGSLRAGT